MQSIVPTSQILWSSLTYCKTQLFLHDSFGKLLIFASCTHKPMIKCHYYSNTTNFYNDFLSTDHHKRDVLTKNNWNLHLIVWVVTMPGDAWKEEQEKLASTWQSCKNSHIRWKQVVGGEDVSHRSFFLIFHDYSSSAKCLPVDHVYGTLILWMRLSMHFFPLISNHRALIVIACSSDGTRMGEPQSMRGISGVYYTVWTIVRHFFLHRLR